MTTCLSARASLGRPLSLVAALGAVLALCLAGFMACPLAGASVPAPPVHVGHVFVIVLENESSTSTFGDPSADPYLASTLPSEGAFLPNFYATGHASNDNYVAMVSGQPANVLNQSDCVFYVNFVSLFVYRGMDEGAGCVYPKSTQNIGTQLTAAGLTWKDYQQDMGNIPSRESAACGHPKVGARDLTQEAVPGDGYAARHNPFVYFHDVIDNTAYCDAHVVALGGPLGSMPSTALPGERGLSADLTSVATTANYSFITPNLCEDGHDYPCKNQASGPSALADIDQFLETWVPIITNSAAFRENGLLEITFDEADTSDASACCGEVRGIGSPEPGIEGPGGGRIGTVLLSPFIAPGTMSTRSYNHFSALASFEDIFGLPRLAEAGFTSSTFGPDVFTNPSGGCIKGATPQWLQCP
jgi:phosphatidylinositol-3-phosphatase